VAESTGPAGQAASAQLERSELLERQEGPALSARRKAGEAGWRAVPQAVAAVPRATAEK
jgi:hypothetical protein